MLILHVYVVGQFNCLLKKQMSLEWGLAKHITEIDAQINLTRMLFMFVALLYALLDMNYKVIHASTIVTVALSFFVYQPQNSRNWAYLHTLSCCNLWTYLKSAEIVLPLEVTSGTENPHTVCLWTFNLWLCFAYLLDQVLAHHFFFYGFLMTSFIFFYSGQWTTKGLLVFKLPLPRRKKLKSLHSKRGFPELHPSPKTVYKLNMWKEWEVYTKMQQ